MPLGPFLRRELITAVRRRTAFADRCFAGALMAAAAAGCLVVWDWMGWDRASVSGAAAFARAAFGLIIAAEAVFVLALVPALVAPAIASERDRKSLDSLLTTRLTAADIVLGTMGAGLLRYANGLATLVPVLTLLAFCGGIDPRIVLLAGAGLASTAVALAALAVTVSTGATTAARATSSTVALALAWLFLPAMIVMGLPVAWPAAVPWVAPVAVCLLDSSPIGVALNLAGAVVRGSPIVAVLRMIALQGAGAVVLVLWAIARLRPASRAVYDQEGRGAILRALRARWRRRPPCGDDPVLWYEIHSHRGISTATLLVARLYTALWVGILSYVISWFAVPAFAELSRNGYGTGPGKPAFPDLNPFARVLVAKLMSLPDDLAPAQARLEFNIVLRQATGLIDLMFVLMVAAAAAESVAVERERQTWLGLIASPLTGREILRAKMLGSIWRARWPAWQMLALWTVGLLAGAVHPLGFLAALAGMGVSCWFLAALGVFASLRLPDRGQATGLALASLLLCLCLGALPFVMPGMFSVLLASGTMPFQAWESLLSYEDVRAAIHSDAIPQFAAIGIRSGEGSRIVLVAWLISTTGQAVAAFLLTRSAVLGFDAAVGRPMRTRDAEHRS